ncbi:hypothetical protein FZEAL_851 [Fusarium zealandicum]|uniref:Peptidase S54 rhomboid domain-containing protein n=1 Tax=Fusarium zealandicum TaxID=1053134 RepID=A0A8H4UTY1_9HYPO|nr:hypothetical protein FZEAL_851 [Fusarium zealandicum]
MRPRLQNFNTLRARSYVFRLPLFTRLIVLVIIAVWIASVQSVWDLREWGALIPDQISIFSGKFRIILDISLTSIPAVLYVVIELWVFRANNAVLGASMWVFVLLAMESIRTYKSNPHFVIGTVHIPTWTTPLIMCLVVAALIPRTTLLGHLCSVAVGYIAGFGLVKYLAPPEWALRWIEKKLNLLAILPHYVSVDKTTYGRFGVLPTTNRTSGSAATELVGTTQRLGP